MDIQDEIIQKIRELIQCNKELQRRVSQVENDVRKGKIIDDILFPLILGMVLGMYFFIKWLKRN